MTDVSLTDEFIRLQEKHRSLLTENRTDLVGDVMMEFADLYKGNGDDFSRDLYYLEAAQSYYEHDRLKDCRNVLKLMND